MKILEKIVITTVPKISNGGCIPYIEVLSGKDFELLWTNKYSQNLKSYKNTRSSTDDRNNRHLTKITIEIDQDPLL